MIDMARIRGNSAILNSFLVPLLILGPVAEGLAAPKPTAAECNAVFNISAVGVLNFGGILSGTATGTVTVDETGLRTYAGGVTPVLSTSTSAAQISGSTGVLDCTGVKVAITLPASITLTGPGSPMTVDTFTTSLPKSGKWDYLTTNLFIGGTLTVGASQVPGQYTGTFSVDMVFE